MNVLATGFVAADAGSVASANAVLLRGLLKRGHYVQFFTKPSFVDPRKIAMPACESERLEVVDCTNRWADELRRSTSRLPLVNQVTGWMDSSSYNRGVVKSMSVACQREHVADVSIWLGDQARGRIKGVASISFLQGPPATDARSIGRHRRLITRLAGPVFYRKIQLYSTWRMSVGLPDFSHSDHLIVGSQWSRSDMIHRFGQPADRVHALPYPIDLDKFQPAAKTRDKSGRLRVLWLGRFVPRKRLDLFLDGLQDAIQSGCDVEALVIGSSAFVPNYERLIEEFPFPDRMKYLSSVPREEVPDVLADVDVLAQPSDDENFGSSVAEALACGVPCIVGRTNGTGDYVCDRSIILWDDSPKTMANAILTMARRKAEGILQCPDSSRRTAEANFHPDIVIEKLIGIMSGAVNGRPTVTQ